MAELRLELVTRENVRNACLLRLRPDQEDLVAPVAWSLADAYAWQDVAWPRLVYLGDQLVGFVMGAFGADDSSDLFRAYLWRLNISADHQRTGAGRFAVGEFCHEAFRRGHDRVTVSFHPGENGPEGFYQRLGFRRTGAVNHGEVVAECVLTADGQLPGPAA
ncbi:MAG TPA: GNAT family N-acetyltransferase [Streptosporangiaceae bacterium]